MELLTGLPQKPLSLQNSSTPHIALTMLLPYHPAEQTIDLPKGFDGTLYPEGLENVPRRFAISKANRYMAGHSDYIIAYVWHPASNASAILQYAKTRNTLICNLADRSTSP